MKEIWKPVVGWEGYYEVSNLARVRNLLTGHIKNITKPVSEKGQSRFYANLTAKGRKRKNARLSLLVARAFLGELPEDFVCDHIDRNPLNDRLDNLRYISQSANVLNSDKIDNSLNVYYTDKTPRLKNRWRTVISRNNKTFCFGSYTSELEARKEMERVKFLLAKGYSCEDIKSKKV